MLKPLNRTQQFVELKFELLNKLKEGYMAFHSNKTKLEKGILFEIYDVQRAVK